MSSLADAEPIAEDLGRAYRWNTAGVAAQNLVFPLLTIVVGRIEGAVGLGLMTLAFGLATQLFSLGMWGGRTYQVSDVEGRFASRDYVLMRLLLVVPMLLGAAGFAVASGYGPTLLALIVVLTVFKGTESVADALYGVLQRHGDLRRVGAFLLVRAVAGLVAFVGVDLATRSTLLASAALAATNLVVLLGLEMPAVRGLEPQALSTRSLGPGTRHAARIAALTFPALAATFLAMLLVNIPRWFVERHDPGHLAVFGLLALIPTVVLLAMTFIVQPQVVPLATLLDDGDLAGFQRLLLRLTGVTTVVGLVTLVGAWALGPLVLGLVYGLDLAPFRTDIALMVLGGLADAWISLAITALTIMRRFRGMVAGLVAGNVLLAALCAALTPTGGLRAAVVSFVVACVATASILFLVHRRETRRWRRA